MKKRTGLLATFIASAALLSSSPAAWSTPAPQMPQAQPPAEGESSTPEKRYVEYRGFNARAGIVEMYDFNEEKACERLFSLVELGGLIAARNQKAIAQPEFSSQECQDFDDVADTNKKRKISWAFAFVAKSGGDIAVNLLEQDIKEKAVPPKRKPKAGQFLI